MCQNFGKRNRLVFTLEGVAVEFDHDGVGPVLEPPGNMGQV